MSQLRQASFALSTRVCRGRRGVGRRRQPGGLLLSSGCRLAASLFGGGETERGVSGLSVTVWLAGTTQGPRNMNRPIDKGVRTARLWKKEMERQGGVRCEWEMGGGQARAHSAPVVAAAAAQWRTMDRRPAGTGSTSTGLGSRRALTGARGKQGWGTACQGKRSVRKPAPSGTRFAVYAAIFTRNGQTGWRPLSAHGLREALWLWLWLVAQPSVNQGPRPIRWRALPQQPPGTSRHKREHGPSTSCNRRSEQENHYIISTSTCASG